LTTPSASALLPEQNPEAQLCDQTYDKEQDKPELAAREQNRNGITRGSQHEKQKDVLEKTLHVILTSS
jgi:hypothetical protein